MPVTPQWVDDDKRILKMHFTQSGIEDWQEFRQVIDTTIEIAQSVPHNMVVIFDPYHIPLPPGNPIPLLRYGFDSRPDNVIGIVIIVSNQFAVKILNWLQRLGIYKHLWIVNNQADADNAIATLLGQADVVHH